MCRGRRAAGTSEADRPIRVPPGRRAHHRAVTGNKGLHDDGERRVRETLPAGVALGGPDHLDGAPGPLGDTCGGRPLAAHPGGPAVPGLRHASEPRRERPHRGAVAAGQHGGHRRCDAGLRGRAAGAAVRPAVGRGRVPGCVGRRPVGGLPRRHGLRGAAAPRCSPVGRGAAHVEFPLGARRRVRRPVRRVGDPRAEPYAWPVAVPHGRGAAARAARGRAVPGLPGDAPSVRRAGRSAQRRRDPARPGVRVPRRPRRRRRPGTEGGFGWRGPGRTRAARPAPAHGRASWGRAGRRRTPSPRLPGRAGR